MKIRGDRGEERTLEVENFKSLTFIARANVNSYTQPKSQRD